MAEPPFDWAGEQMTQAGIKEPIKRAVDDLLRQYWEHAFGKQLTKPEEALIIEIFSKLAQGHVLVKDEPDAVWVQARPGGLVIRDRVRVRSDAYHGPAGVAHNGREGVIVAIRQGDIHVRYTDGRNPSPDFVRHSPHSLEKRIR
jgi:hypothetical protein